MADRGAGRKPVAKPRKRARAAQKRRKSRPKARSPRYVTKAIGDLRNSLKGTGLRLDDLEFALDRYREESVHNFIVKAVRELEQGRHGELLRELDRVRNGVCTALQTEGDCRDLLKEASEGILDILQLEPQLSEYSEVTLTSEGAANCRSDEPLGKRKARYRVVSPGWKHQGKEIIPPKIALIQTQMEEDDEDTSG